MTTDDTAWRRAALTEELTRDGWLRTVPWRQAFRAVPRDLFLPRFFRLTPDGRRYGAIDREHSDRLDLVYGNTVVTTQLDGDDDRWEYARRHGPVEGTPTSSSTQPSLMASMLEALDVDDEVRVLEVGTGTGYNAALLSYRLGSGLVTSVEYDRDVARRAGRSLASAGYHPTLAVGDGAAGHPPGAPYDRLLATYSVPAVPPAWLAQLRPGGVLVTSLYRDLQAGLLVRLTATDAGTAHGNLLDDSAYFMPTRTHSVAVATALVRAAVHADGDTRTVEPSDLLTEKSTGWTALAALLLPGVARLDLARDDGDVRWLVHPDGSWAYHEVGGRRVEQGGSRCLWNELEAVHERWRSLGAPARERLGLTVTPDGRHRVWLDEERHTVASCPASG